MKKKKKTRLELNKTTIVVVGKLDQVKGGGGGDPVYTVFTHRTSN